MLRNKKLSVLFLALFGILFSVGVRASSSSLIPLSEISDESANYRTAVVERTDAVNERTAAAYLYLPVEHRVYYEGANAYFVKDLAAFGNEIGKDTPVYEITPDVDEIRLTELRLEKETAARQYEEDCSARNKEIDKLVKQHAEAVPGDPYTAELLDYRVKIMNIEAEKAAYEYDRKIRMLDKEIGEIEEEQERTTVDSPYEGRLTFVQSMAAGTLIREGDHIMSVTDTSKVYLQTNGAIPSGRDVKVTVSFRGNDYEFQGKSVVNCGLLTSGTNNSSIIEIDQKDLMSISSNLRQLDVRAVRINVTYTDSSMKNVLCVPTDALTKGETDNLYYAEILDKENVIHRRLVKAMLLNNKTAWVIDGLQEGDVVVLQ